MTMRRRVLRKALEVMPNSVKLWQAAIDLEGPDDARLMLGRAVECVPHAVDMWLALARLETYQNARKVLNKAREKIPTEPQIWITASKLEEANGNVDLVDRIIEKAIKSLALHQVDLEREQWLARPRPPRRRRASRTAQAIVRETLAIGVEEEDRKRIWIEDAESFVARGCPECARAVYAEALKALPHEEVGGWRKAALHEKKHGTRESARRAAAQGRLLLPARRGSLADGREGEVAGRRGRGARAILNEAFRANPDSEQVWLAAVKLESENDQPDAARQLLAKARERAGTERVWMKSARARAFSRATATPRSQLLGQALKVHPKYWKLLLMRAQLERAA